MQVQYKFTKLRRFAVCTIMACSLMALAGCTTPGVSVTITFPPNQPTKGKTISSNVTMLATQFARWIQPVSGTDLSSVDPSQAVISYSLSNAAIVSTNGSATITLTDANTGSTVGQETFPYVVTGNSLSFQDPTAVSAWLNQFTSSSSLNVTIAASTDIQAISSGTATVTNNVAYQGASYASASTSWVAPAGCGGVRPIRQFCD